MKHCPKCEQTFAVEYDFCLNDGSLLVVDLAPSSGGFGSSGDMPTQFVPRPGSTPPTGGTSGFLYLVIGVLATALLAVGAYLFLGGDKEKREDWAVATAPIASNTAKPTPEPSNANRTAAGSPATGRTADPTGRWDGRWSTATGALYGFQLTLNGGDNSLTGEVLWTLRRTSRPDKRHLIGVSATEYVAGRFDPATGVVTLKGTSKSDPAGLLVMLDDYRLDLSPDNSRLTGKARNGGKWNGIVDLSR